ncbi:MAG: DUF4254 domain-containing protein [Pirellulaceae bacterium]|nr:DUF4254 domain-containing protein [Pirellulaceae bacterium]
MLDVKRVNKLHAETVERWHHESIENSYDGVWSIICKQHSFNFLLWHEEDIARSQDVSDKRIAEVKRAIDGYNQQRNDWIEKIDDWLTGYLAESRIAPAVSAPLNTETPGSVIDRLSIQSLRVYHLREQLERTDVDQSHIDSVEQKIAKCLLQHHDLSNSLQELLNDIQAGKKRHNTYRQFKMYNDPTLNPQLYKRAG